MAAIAINQYREPNMITIVIDEITHEVNVPEVYDKVGLTLSELKSWVPSMSAADWDNMAADDYVRVLKQVMIDANIGHE